MKPGDEDRVEAFAGLERFTVIAVEAVMLVTVMLQLKEEPHAELLLLVVSVHCAFQTYAPLTKLCAGVCWPEAAEEFVMFAFQMPVELLQSEQFMLEGPLTL